MAGKAQQAAEAPAGCLVFRSTDQPDSDRICYVYPHDEFDFGRDDMLTLDPCLSKHHFRIRCISYEGDDTQVDPLIYLRILSNNEAQLSRYGLDKTDQGITFGKQDGDVLLNGGDRLQLTSKTSVTFKTMAASIPDSQPASNSVRDAEKARFRDRYRVSNRKLGAGGYASVFVAEKCSTSRQLACKIVPVRIDERDAAGNLELTQQLKQHREKLAREYNLLKDLSHPNIISLERVIRTTHKIYIFEELVTGGDLLSYLDRTGALTEPQAAVISRQVLEAVTYLHDRNIAHRDIKPENILLTSWRDGARVVLTDFGQSRTFSHTISAADKQAKMLRMQSVVGTHGYAAPEIYRERDFHDTGYSQAVDIWSIGCVTATMLTNEFIFPDNVTLRRGSVTHSQYTRKLEDLDKEARWAHIGHRAKSFIRGCLATNEEERLSARQCLALPWFQHPHYKAEFDAAYQRAIADWHPRGIEGDVIEFIDTSDIVAEEETQDEEQDTRSRHFQPPPSKKELESMLARFRPASLRASPIAMPESASDLVERNLDLASQNTQANLAALHNNARQAPVQRKKMYR